MFLYGHMLREQDRLTYQGAPVIVKDIWDSKILLTKPVAGKPACTGAKWIELWTYSPDDIERPVAVVLVGDFDGFGGVERQYALTN